MACPSNTRRQPPHAFSTLVHRRLPRMHDVHCTYTGYSYMRCLFIAAPLSIDIKQCIVWMLFQQLHLFRYSKAIAYWNIVPPTKYGRSLLLDRIWLLLLTTIYIWFAEGASTFFLFANLIAAPRIPRQRCLHYSLLALEYYYHYHYLCNSRTSSYVLGYSSSLDENTTCRVSGLYLVPFINIINIYY